jgi:hypothetical protein
MKKLMLFVWVNFVLTVSVLSVSAALPFKLQQNYFTGLSSPLFLTNAGDGSRRIFIVQQRGIIKVAQPGSSVVSDYLNISGVVSSSGSERGLLGLAFHPQFESNRRFFVYYTRQSDGAVEIAEYEQSASNPNIANPTVIRVIITIPHPGQSNHNGGTIAFGPDGFLYAAPGDGGGANDVPNNAQNIESLLGKMLRIDINTPVGQTPAYNIPSTNPYVGVAGRDEIYAIGLRNPYRFSFDRGGTNQLWVADVGQNAIEEVDIITLGGNYGWRVYEGTQCTTNDPTRCDGQGGDDLVQVPPVFQYSRIGNGRCSITGGNVYRGKQNALPIGAYVYGDFCSGEILLWNGSQQSLLLDTSNNNLSAFGEDEDGELYVVRLSGVVDKIVGSRATSDFDGDGGTDYSVFRPGTGVWYASSPLNNSFQAGYFGVATDIPVSEDFDGDAKTDFAVYRPDEGTWYYVRSSNSTVGAVRWGLSSDIPTPGDFDGDRVADLAIYRPDPGQWYILFSSNSSFSVSPFGTTEDIPVNSDFDGDGRDDIAVWRPSTGVWWRVNSSDGALSASLLGQSGDVPAPGDFDGDGKTDLGIYRPSGGLWFIARSSDATFQIVQWGIAEDRAVVGDYDRDYRDDIAIWRPSAGTWWVQRSSDSNFSVAQFGISDDLPIPRYDKP